MSLIFKKYLYLEFVMEAVLFSAKQCNEVPSREEELSIFCISP